MQKINVKCSFVISGEVPENDENYNQVFDIEENHCFATGNVGYWIETHIKKCEEEGICWVCALGGECEIIA